MANTAREWEEVEDFPKMAEKLIQRYNDILTHVEADQVIAYMCTNKEKPKGKSKLYEMTSQTEPESFTNTKTYFVKMFQSTWEELDDEGRLALVFSCLNRIDPQNPGKLLSNDLQDQRIMVETFGVDWFKRKLPNLLTDAVDIKR